MLGILSRQPVGFIIVDRKREIGPSRSEGLLWDPVLASVPFGFHRCALGQRVHVFKLFYEDLLLFPALLSSHRKLLASGAVS